MTKHVERAEHHGRHHQGHKESALNEQAANLLTSSEKWLKGNGDAIAKDAAVDSFQPKKDQYSRSEWIKAQDLNEFQRRHFPDLDQLDGILSKQRNGILTRHGETSHIDDLHKDIRRIMEGHAVGDEITGTKMKIVNDWLKRQPDRQDDAKKMAEWIKDWQTGKLDAYKTRDGVVTMGSFDAARDKKFDQDKKDLDALAGKYGLLQQLQDRKDLLDADGKAMADAAKPVDDLFERARVHKGDGYYQISAKLLGLDGQKHEHREVMALTRQLQELSKENGKLPPYLSTKMSLVTDENFAQLMDQIEQKAKEREAAKKA